MQPATGRSPLLLGIDVGTQSLRAALVDTFGRTVSFGIAPIDTVYPRPTWAEQEPLQWWSAARAATGLALRAGGRRRWTGRRHRTRLHGLHGRCL